MEILKVKDNGQGGYTVNDTMSVPNVESNRHYRMVQEWITNGGVVEPFETAAEIAARQVAEANQVIYEELEALDKASIRDIREWIAAQATAPQRLKDREATAVAARGGLQ